MAHQPSSFYSSAFNTEDVQRFYESISSMYDTLDTSWKNIDMTAGRLLSAIDACFTETSSSPEFTTARPAFFKALNVFTSEAGAYMANRNNRVYRDSFKSQQERLALLFLQFLEEEFERGNVVFRDGKYMYRCLAIPSWLIEKFKENAKYESMYS